MTDEGAQEQGRSWRGQSPSERREARRRRLLDAALDLYGTVGYAGTSITALCAHANVSPRHFYELYPDREAVMTELYDELVGDVVRLVSEAQADAPLLAEQRVSAGLRAAIEHETEDPRRARVLLLEAVGVSPSMERHRRSVMALFADATERQYRLLVADGQLVDRPFHEISMALLGAFDELLVQWLLSEPRRPAQELLPIAEEVFLAVFRGRASTGNGPGAACLHQECHDLGP